MTAEVVHMPMSLLNAMAPYVCVAGAERERVGGEREVKGREKQKRQGDGGDGRERNGKRWEMREREREVLVQRKIERVYCTIATHFKHGAHCPTRARMSAATGIGVCESGLCVSVAFSRDWSRSSLLSLQTYCS